MAAQIELTFDNLEAVLADAGCTLADVVRLNIFTTDMDTLFGHLGRIARRLEPPQLQAREHDRGSRPPGLSRDARGDRSHRNHLKR